MIPGVILVCGQYPTAERWGGIGTYTRHHAHRLRAAGVPVQVITGESPDAPFADADDGIEVHRIVPTSGGDAGLNRVALALILSTVLSETGDAIVEGPEYAAPLLEFQRARPDVPVVIRLHGAATLVREAAQSPLRARLSRLSAAAQQLERDERESVARATLVSSPSEWTVQALRARGWDLGGAPLVVTNAVADVTPPSRRVARAMDSVCVLGRLDRIKGADLLPAVMQRVWRRRPSTRFVCIGQDGQRTSRETWGAWIRHSIPSRHRAQVDLCGGVAPDAVRGALATQRIALIASVFETFSYTLVECMTEGLACVVASAGGPRELGRHGTHLMLAQRTPDAIADSLVHLLASPGTVTTLGADASAHVRDVLASPLVTARVIDRYDTLISAPVAARKIA